MIFDCDRKELSRTLKLLARVADTRVAAKRHLGGVLIRPVNQNAVRLTTTDGKDAWLEARLRAKVRMTGTLLLPVKLLAEIAKRASADTVSVSALASDEDGLVSVTSNDAQWKLKRLVWIGPQDFPKPPATGMAQLEIPLTEYVAGIRRVLHAVSRDETRPLLNGVCMERLRARLTLVATDTHRLAVTTLRVPQGRKAQWVLPLETVQLLLRCVKSCDDGAVLQFSANEWHCAVALGPWRLRTRLREGEYPNYTKVVPTEFDRTLRLEREPLEAALGGAMPVAAQDANRIVFGAADGEMRMGAESRDEGRYDAAVPCNLDGPAVEIAFNGRYLLQALRATEGDEVELALSGPLGAAKFQSDDGSHDVLMPMQIM